MKSTLLFSAIMLFLSCSVIAQMNLTVSSAQNTLCNGPGCNYTGPGIMINEVMIAPATGNGSIIGTYLNQQAEWIELYNPDLCHFVDVSCYILGNVSRDGIDDYSGGYEIPSGTIIPPRGFLVIRGTAATAVPANLLVQNGGKTVELVVNNTSRYCVGTGGFRLWFPDLGGWFGFYDANGVPLDAIKWGQPPASVLDERPCNPTGGCDYPVQLASYNEFPENRKSVICTYSLTQNHYGKSHRRYPDGGAWPGPPVQQFTPTYGTCNSTCIPAPPMTCNGQASVTVNGGTPPYSYQWNDPQYQSTQTASGLCPGIYCVTVTDTLGLTASACVAVLDFKPEVSLGPFTDVCLNDSAFALYSGIPAGGVYSGPGVANGVFYPALAGQGEKVVTYTYYTTDSCSNKASCLLNVKTVPVAAVFPTNHVVCSGTSTYISISAVGFAPGISFTWTASLISGTASGFADGSGTKIIQTLYDTLSEPAVVKYSIVPHAGGCSGDTVSAYVTVVPGPSVAGQLTYLNTQTNIPLNCATVYLRTPSGEILDSTLTDKNGNYWFCGLSDGNYKLSAGCIKICGSINSIDALLDLRHFVTVITLTGLPFKAGDVNGSSNINGIDGLLIIKRFAGMIDDFDIGRWVSEEPQLTVSGVSTHIINFNALCTGDVNGSHVPRQLRTAYAGPDQLNLIYANTLLNANLPDTGEIGTWTILNGSGGVLTDVHDPQSRFLGIPSQDYQLKWTISNECGNSSSDTVLITTVATAASPCMELPSITYGGQDYNTVKIGDQCWMRENLNIGKMVQSTGGTVPHSDCSNNGIIEKYCINNDSANCAVYGGLYDWNEMMQYAPASGPQAICPAGFHLPALAEWNILMNYLGGMNAAGGKMKVTGTTYWNSPNSGATNESGFSALGSGMRHAITGVFSYKYYAFLWTSAENNATTANYKLLSYDGSSLYNSFEDKAFGFSVRCLKDTCLSPPTTSDAGPDQAVIGNSAQLQANVPAAGTGTWSNLSASGGVFSDIHDPAATFTGNPAHSYTLVWTIMNNCYVASRDTVVITLLLGPGQPCPGTASLIYDGKTYHTVQIGLQCWMKENLDIGKMIPGSVDQTDNDTIEKYCYADDTANCAIYGGLYQWHEMMHYTGDGSIQGICPSGWHVPADEEWTTLIDFLGGYSIAGAGLKDTGTILWLTPNSGATNSSGFTVLPGGYRSIYGPYFGQINKGADFWQSSYYDEGQTWDRYLYYNGTQVSRTLNPKNDAYSVRCLKDTCDLSLLQPDAGPDQLYLCETTIMAAEVPPAGLTGTWTIVSGTGGYLDDVHNPVSLFSGLEGQAYELVWAISNSCNQAVQDTVLISYAFPQAQACPDIPTVTYGGQVYNTVQIGNQCWIRENLNIGTMVIDHYTGASHSHCSDNGIIEKYCYDNDPAKCEEYGGLYDWNELMQYKDTAEKRGICPPGFHVPDLQEFNEMISFLGGATVAGGKLKQPCYSHWFAPNTGGMNESGYTAIGAGYRRAYGSSYALNDGAYFWINDMYDTANVWYFYMISYSNMVYTNYAGKYYGLSARCVRDTCTLPPTQSDAGPDQTVFSDSTLLQGNTPLTGTGTWYVISGTGGSLSGIHDPGATFTGIQPGSYKLEWVISNACYVTSRDTVEINFFYQAGIPCPGTPVITYGGQVYNTVQIGYLCWMKENLNIGTMVEDHNTGVPHSHCSDNGTIEKYCYDNDTLKCTIWGGLYDWNEMMQYNTTPGIRGICPAGWHIPTHAEWCGMLTFLDPSVNCNASAFNGFDAGGKLKIADTLHWSPPNNGATNVSGFSAFGSGCRAAEGYSAELKTRIYYWNSNDNSPEWAPDFFLENIYASIGHGSDYKTCGLSVRCIRDTCTLPPAQSYAGPDQFYLCDTAIMAANVPTAGQTGTWYIVSGAGGNVTDIHNPQSSFTGQEGQLYELVWAIINACGHESRDTVLLSYAFPQPQACPDIPTVNYGGRIYNTVQIGNQCWIRENMNIGLMVIDDYQGTWHTHCSDNGIIEKYCYDNDPAMCEEYGGFYNWDEMMQYTDDTNQRRGICPEGFHIPGLQEWNQLISFLGGEAVAGGKIKQPCYSHWMAPNTGATNESGFSAAGAGFRNPYGSFAYLKEAAYFWLSSIYNQYNLWYSRVLFNSENTNSYGGGSANATSVRCIRDTCSLPPTQSEAGPDQTVVGDSTLLQGNTPVNGTGTWYIISGTGGSLSGIHDPGATFTGIQPRSYKLEWVISNACYVTSRDTVEINFFYQAGIPCPGTPVMTYGGQVYNTIQIGSQCWMKENLNIGNLIIDSVNQSDNGTIEKYCYANDTAYCAIYGGLYQWNEMMQYTGNGGMQGICPSGWHVPRDEEWTILIEFMGGYSLAGAGLKDTGTILWLTPNSGATNSSGFTALPGGYHSIYGSYFGQINKGADFWQSSYYAEGQTWDRYLYYNGTQVSRTLNPKNDAYAVRCLKDTCTISPAQSDAGPDQYYLCDTAMLAGIAPPTGQTGTWFIVSGTGGNISDIHNPLSSFTGQEGQLYELVWAINNACGHESRDTVLLSYAFPQPPACPDIPTINYGGRIYNTVQIGNQCWIKENMNIGLMVIDDYQGTWHTHCSDNGHIEKYCYDNDPAKCEEYGGLYDWDEMMQYTEDTNQRRGICPEGFHVPGLQEWNQLISFLGGAATAGGKLKQACYSQWLPPNTAGRNESGFTAVGSGFRHYHGYSDALREASYFWLSSRFDQYNLWYFGVHYNSEDIYSNGAGNTNALSVRCVRDTCSLPPSQSDAGPDQTVFGDSTLLQGNTSVNGTGTWYIISGTGGSLSGIHDPGATFTGIQPRSYKLEWVISNACYVTSRDTVEINFFYQAGIPCPGTPVMTYGGQVYNTIQIGSQCWMKENLNIGNLIIDSVDQSDNGSIEKYCFDNDSANCGVYGGLYQWREMMQYVTSPVNQGICPMDWHLPSDEEWCVLTSYLDPAVNCGAWGWSGPNAGGKMKETGYDHWYTPNAGATNESGFTALGAGNRGSNGSFAGLTSWGFFWSSVEYNAESAISRYLSYSHADISRVAYQNTRGFSVRCLKDTCTLPPAQSNAGPDQLSILGDTSATLAANAPPTGQTGTWTIVGGTGGNLDDIHNPAAVFTGDYAQTYMLKWTITNPCGITSSDTVLVAFHYDPDSLFLVGGSVPNIGWNPVAAIPFTKTAPGKFTIASLLTVSGYGFKFLVEHSWNNNWGQAYGPYGALAQVPNENAYVASDGYYQVNVDFTTMTYSCQAIDTVVYPQNLLLVGGSCPVTGWDSLAAIQFTQTAYGIYTLYAPLTISGGGLKFLTGNTFTGNYGQAFGPEGTLSQEPNQNVTVPEDGFYRISVNFLNMSYNLTKTEWGILGSAIPPYNWAEDVNLEYVGGSEPFTWKINNLEVIDGEFKFRANDTWDINLGDDGNNGILEHNAANIPVSAGIHTVKLILSPGNWTYTLTSSAGSACPGMPEFEYDGHIYHTVKIGNQCWMKENLDIGTMVTSSGDQTDNGIIEKYCYNDDTSNCNTYGGLYKWNEMMQYSVQEGVQGICPVGWHLPTNAEHAELVTFLGGTGVAGGKLKEAGLAHWSTPNTGATNVSGYTALPGGGYFWDGFNYLTTYAYFWSSSENSPSLAWHLHMDYDLENVAVDPYDKNYAMSVRCLRDIPTEDTLNPDAVIIDTTGSALLSDSAQLSQGIYVLQFSGDPPELDTGKIIVGPHGEGFLRKITGIINPGNPITLQTELATMEDLFNTVEFGFQSGLPSLSDGPAAGNVKVDYLADGISMKMLNGFVFDFSNTPIYEDDDFSISISEGTVTFNPNFTGDIDFEFFKLNEFHLNSQNSSLSLNCNLNIHSEAESSIEAFNKKLADVSTKVPIPGIPVFVTIRTELMARLDLTVGAAVDVNTEFSDTYTVSLGVNYMNESWSGMYNSNNNLQVSKPQITGTINVEQKLTIIPVVTIKFYGVIGPYIRPELWEKFSLEMATPSFDWNSDVTLGLDATVGVTATGIGELDDFTNTWPFSMELWNGPDTIIEVSGNNQAGVAGQPLPQPLKVSVHDNFGNALAGARVHFEVLEGGGSVNPLAAFTNTSGIAETIWTLGNGPGESWVRASVIEAGGDTIAYTDFTIKTPCCIDIDTGNNQIGQLGQPLPLPITAIVTDYEGEPFQGVIVHFQANNGGSVSQSQLMTDIDGKASVAWTLGPTDSVQTVTCTAFMADSITPLQGSPLTFTAHTNLTGCPGLPSFSYGGQTYNTVLIGSQCWMKENLNIGTMVTDNGQQSYPNTQCSNNGIIEKYCYGNNVANCNEHGGLYDWDEMMQYTTVPGVQGICPSGWHIPTMVDIQALVNYLDPTVNWGMSGMSGTDGGGKLKETGTTHWNSPNTGATNISGFTFLGVGNRDYRGGFFSSGLDGYIWSSLQTSYSIAADLLLHHNFAGINNDVSGKTNGFPVRCIKNP